MECESNNQYRPCLANGKPGFFHAWEQYSEIVAPSALRGGHGGGVIASMLAIVEYDDGTVGRCEPGKVKFTDRATPPEPPKAEKPKRKEREYWTPINCPTCKEPGNENGILFADSENREYFAYCEKCNRETGSYKTKKEALKAFETMDSVVIGQGQRKDE